MTEAAVKLKKVQNYVEFLNIRTKISRSKCDNIISACQLSSCPNNYGHCPSVCLITGYKRKN